MVDFGYEQGNESIWVYFNDCAESINYLIDDGYLDEKWRDFDPRSEDELVYSQKVADAVIDKLQQTAEDYEDEVEELQKEVNDVVRATIVMDMNLYFNQFLEYRPESVASMERNRNW